jgi:hypothetical protein
VVASHSPSTATGSDSDHSWLKYRGWAVRTAWA